MLLGLGRMMNPARGAVAGGGGALPLEILDQLTAAGVATYAAFSIRKVRSAYSGSCLRLRRDSDNAEADIGFGGDGWIDESAVTAHLGGSNGFIRTWYDQSGNGRDLEQATTGLQFTYLGATVDNGRPAMRGSSGCYMTRASMATMNGVALAVVFERSTAADSSRRHVCFYKFGENDFSGADSGILLQTSGWGSNGQWLGNCNFECGTDDFALAANAFQTTGNEDKTIVSLGDSNGFFRGNGSETSTDTHTAFSDRAPDGFAVGTGYIGGFGTNHTGTVLDFQELLLTEQVSAAQAQTIESDWAAFGA